MIFVDSSAFIASYWARDRDHAEAVAFFDQLAATREPLFTSNFVLDEVLTLIGRRTSYAFAAARGRSIFASSAITILRPDAEQELLALRQFEKFADQRVSFTDCVSFALMRAHRLSRVFTFDRHFALAGLTVVPGPLRGRGEIHEPPAEEYGADPQSS